MGVLCDPERGLFPRTEELDLHCSCPDGAWLCKHLAAVLYGVGARLDEAPELLFTLRGVPQGDLLADASAIGSRANAAPASRFSDAELSEIFGIELGGRADPAGEALEPRGPRRRGAGSGKGKAGTGRARARRRSRS
jgi:hypothetical protein